MFELVELRRMVYGCLKLVELRRMVYGCLSWLN